MSRPAPPPPPSASISTHPQRKQSYFRKASNDAGLSVIDPALFKESQEWSHVEETLQDFLEIALQSYVNSWYPSLTPRDRSLLPHLHKTLTLLLASLSRSIFTQHQTRRTHVLCLETIPELIRDHFEGWERARRDVEDGGDDDGGKQSRERRRQAIADRFHLLYPHPAIERKAVLSISSQAVTSGTKIEGGSQPQKPVTPVGPQPDVNIHEFLNEAMSSSITSTHPHHHPLPAVPARKTSDLAKATAKPPVIADETYSRNSLYTYSISPTYLTTLSHRLIHYHLSSTSLQSDIERSMIIEVLGSAVLGNATRKMSEGWMIMKILLAVLGDPVEQAVEQQKDEARELRGAGGSDKERDVVSLGSLATSVFHSSVLLLRRLTTMLLLISRLWTTLSRDWRAATSSTSGVAEQKKHFGEKNGKTEPGNVEPAYRTTSNNALDGLLGTVAAILRLRADETGKAGKAVWAYLEMVFHTTLVGQYVDRLLPFYLDRHILQPPVINKMLTKGLDVLFPGGVPAPSVPDPTKEEVRVMRAKLLARLNEVLPAHGQTLLYGSSSIKQEKAVEMIIAPIEDCNINVHLILRLLEAVFLTIDPRIAQKID